MPGTLIEATYRHAGESATVAALAAADAGRAAWNEVKGPWGRPGAIAPDDAVDLAARLLDAMRMLGDHVTVATVKEAVGLLSDVLDHLTTIQALAARLAATLGVKQELPVGLALSLINVATALEGLPDGAMKLRGPWLQGADAPQRLATMSDRAAALSNLCAAHAAKNEPDVAIGYCTESLTINEQNWRAYSNRAYAYYLKRSFDEADKDLDIALSINPNARQMPQIRGMMNERRLRGRVTTEEHQ